MIVLDTHAWLWLMSDPQQLGPAARRALRSTQPRGVAAISCWEVAMLAARGRIALDREPIDWMDAAFDSEEIHLLPLTPAVAVNSTELGEFHGDPADRLIVATAISHGAMLVTRDEQIRSSHLVRVLW